MEIKEQPREGTEEGERGGGLSNRTYRRWRALSFFIAFAFLLLPVLFIAYLCLSRLHP